MRDSIATLWQRVSSSLCNLSLLLRNAKKFLPRPDIASDTRLHGRGNTEALMNAHEIIMEEMERQGRFQVVQFLGESIGKPRKSAHLHTDSQILSFNVRSRNMPILRAS